MEHFVPYNVNVHMKEKTISYNKGETMKKLKKIFCLVFAFFALALPLLFTGCDVDNESKEQAYTVTFDYGAAKDLFDNNTDFLSVKTTEWITNLPTIQSAYKDNFIGWFFAGTNKQIELYDSIKGNVTVEARFNVSANLSGLYKNGKYVKTWNQIKDEFPNAFVDSAIVCKIDALPSGQVSSSFFENLSGDLVIDDEITRIGSVAFSHCEDITTVLIPNSVTSIGENAFSECFALRSVTLSETLTTIQYFAFAGCSNLTEIKIPASVTTIQDYAFSYTTGLEVVIIDSETIASNLSSGFLNAYKLYIKSGFNTPTYLTEIFTKQTTTDKFGYDMWLSKE